MGKAKKSFDTQINGLTELHKDTIDKAKAAPDAETRAALAAQATKLFNEIREVEKAKDFYSVKRSLRHPFGG